MNRRLPSIINSYRFSEDELKYLKQIFDYELKNHLVIIEEPFDSDDVCEFRMTVASIVITDQDIEKYEQNTHQQLVNEIEKYINQYYTPFKQKIPTSQYKTKYRAADTLAHLEKYPHYYFEPMVLTPVYLYHCCYSTIQYLIMNKQFGYNFFKGKTPTKHSKELFRYFLVEKGKMLIEDPFAMH
jgi:hypothetical protein